MQGAPKKTSGRSYSQVRPIARHFVWRREEHPSCHSQVIENSVGRDNRLGRNCRLPGKNYWQRLRARIRLLIRTNSGWNRIGYQGNLATPEGVEPPTLRSEV